MAKKVRIFISSPGDVWEERKKARRVIEGLQKQFRDLELEPVLWEELPLPATATFQETIDVILHQKPIDIAVFILWSKLGTPPGKIAVKPDGKEYRSGTEREFDLMLNAFKQSDDKRPLILAYTRHDESWREKLQRPDTPDDRLIELIAQNKLAKAFIKQQFHGKNNENVRAYHSYHEPLGFAQVLRNHLRNTLNDILGAENKALWIESPFLSLNAFDVKHAQIFFGREQETLDVLQQLREQERNGRGFVVIIGASGSGKSSLARAGVAATLMDGLDDGQVWQVAEITPSKHRGDLLAYLTETIAEQIPGITMSISTHGDSTSKVLYPSTAMPPDDTAPTRLLLILDQLEELWTDQGISNTNRNEFFFALQALTESGRISCVATLRADFYAQAQQNPIFLRLKSGSGQFDLIAPETSAIQRMINDPARMAGVQFGTKGSSQQTLDAQLLDDAAKDPAALPLLQYTLTELYDRRDRVTGELSFAEYEKLGGIEGAIATRAEETFRKLSKDSQDSFEEVLPLLVTIDVNGELSPVRRWALIDDLNSSPSRRSLTAALIKARFLATGRESEGTSIARLTHDSLLRRWGMVHDWIGANHEMLKIRAQVELSMQRWNQSGRDETLLLPRGLQLNEARTLLPHSTDVVSAPIREYVQLSLTEVQRSQRRWMSFLGLSICLMLAIFYWYAGKQLADKALSSRPEEIAEIRTESFFVRPVVEHYVKPTASASSDEQETADWATETRRLNAQLLLVGSHPSEFAPQLRARILDFRFFKHMQAICDSLTAADDNFAPELWKIFQDNEASRRSRLLSGLALAYTNSASNQWDADELRFLADACVSEVENLSTIAPMVSPIATVEFLGRLGQIRLDENRQLWERINATQLVILLAEGNLLQLVDLIDGISTAQQFDVVVRALSSFDPQAIAVEMTRRMSVSRDLGSLNDGVLQIARGHADYAIAALRLNLAIDIGLLFSRTNEVDAVTQFVHRCRERGVPAATLLSCLERKLADRRTKEIRPCDNAATFALLLALGEFSINELGLSEKQCDGLADKLHDLYRNDPSSKIHGATGWLLREWGYGDLAEVVDRTVVPYAKGREWYTVAIPVGKSRLDQLLTDRSWLPKLLAMKVLSPSNRKKKAFNAASSIEVLRPLFTTYLSLVDFFAAKQNSVYMTFVVFDAGKYKIGSPKHEQDRELDRIEVRHEVSFTRPFAILDREVTWGEMGLICPEGHGKRTRDFRAVFGRNPASNDPATNSSWTTAESYCRKLTSAAYPNRQESGFSFRLPCEAQWETACRSSSDGRWSFGDDIELLKEYGWYLDNSRSSEIGQRQPHKPKSLRPNHRGIFDMHGNVAEWCRDTYALYRLKQSFKIDPCWTGTGTKKVIRGGNYSQPDFVCRSAQRKREAPEQTSPAIGFRIIQVLPRD